MPETGTNWLRDKFPALAEALGTGAVAATEFRGEVTITIEKSELRSSVATLKRVGFSVMMDLFAVDYSGFPSEPSCRFAVLYNFYSLQTKSRVFLKVAVDETAPEVDSIHDLYQAANWFEREVWDLYGIRFTGHPNLVRILCHAEFVGHPLRKDYPSDGYQRLKSSVPSEAF